MKSTAYLSAVEITENRDKWAPQYLIRAGASESAPGLKCSPESKEGGSLLTSICTMFVGPIMGKFLDYSHPIYRSTYLASFGLTVLALLAGFLLHSKFMARGGPNHYIARE